MLLCLAVQAGSFPGSGTTDVNREELEALWTNVKVILAGLQAYGQMWDGIDLMACKLSHGFCRSRVLNLFRALRI